MRLISAGKIIAGSETATGIGWNTTEGNRAHGWDPEKRTGEDPRG